jgi:hypothetical protein
MAPYRKRMSKKHSRQRGIVKTQAESYKTETFNFWTRPRLQLAEVTNYSTVHVNARKQVKSLVRVTLISGDNSIECWSAPWFF